LSASTSVPVAAAIDCPEFHPSVTEADAGSEVHVEGAVARFSVCLDETKHPLRLLVTAGCPFGYVSNLSANGPDSYPIGFQVTAPGSCTIRNGDFQVRIVTTD
jgi:hypothetical protein